MKSVCLSFVFLLQINLFAQTQKDENTLSFMDKVQSVIELRKSFDTENETKKPALFSYKKDEGEKAVFTIDIAVALRKYRFDTYGVSPFVQFDYSGKSKSEAQKITAGVSTYYRIYNYADGSGKIEPLISYSKDFFTKSEELIARLNFMPQFPKFFIPVRNINEIKFKYDGSKKDNIWVFGINPFTGFNFYRNYGSEKQSDETFYYTSAGSNIALKRYYLQIDLYGLYNYEMDDSRNSNYKYEGTATFYFDEKERSSLNAKYLQEEKDYGIEKKITLGFGIKL